jgi:DNA replication licensing factor MCM6
MYLYLAMDEDGDDETPSQNGMVNGDGPSEPSKPKVRLSYEEYKHMANLMVIHLRQEEEKKEGREQDRVQGFHHTPVTW